MFTTFSFRGWRTLRTCLSSLMMLFQRPAPSAPQSTFASCYANGCPARKTAAQMAGTLHTDWVSLSVNKKVHPTSQPGYALRAVLSTYTLAQNLCTFLHSCGRLQ